MQEGTYLDQINVMPSVKQCWHFWNTTLNSPSLQQINPSKTPHTHIHTIRIFLSLHTPTFSRKCFLWKYKVAEENSKWWGRLKGQGVKQWWSYHWQARVWGCVCEEDGSDVPRGMGIISEGIIHKLGRTCLPILQLGAQSVCIHMCQNICGFKKNGMILSMFFVWCNRAGSFAEG